MTFLVVDVAGELAGRHGLRFETYREAIRALRQLPSPPPALVERLEPLAGFRNVLLREYVALDLELAMAALDDLDAVERFVAWAADQESSGSGRGAGS